MTATQIAAASLALLAVPFWLYSVIAVRRTLRAMPLLSAQEAPAREGWPRVSLVVPARDEAQGLREAIASHLASDYPDLEIVLVDDRSQDGTGGIIDELARQDPRVRPVHVTALPAGWLGKVNALREGLRHASGEWILFSDADVQSAPGTLRKAVAACERRGIDFLAVLPEIWSSGWLLDTALTAFVRFVLGGARVWDAGNPASDAAFGIGAFGLVRRTALEKSAGLEALRLEVADDMALAWLVKRAGARCAAMNGRGELGLWFYRSLGEMTRALEKNSFAIVGRYSFARVLLLTGALLAFELGPFAGLVPVGLPWLPGVSLLGMSLAFAATLPMARWAGRPLLSGVLFPVGTVLIAAMNLRGGFLGWLRGGVRWRETFHPSAELREGSRYRFG